MMISSSTRLLVKLFRWRLAACLLGSFLSMFLFNMDGPDNDSVGMTALLALLLMSLWRLHTRFYEMPFPVTDRQAAWIPIATVFSFWCAGLFGILMAQIYAMLFGRYTLDRFIDFWSLWLGWLPVAALLLLCVLRLMRLNAMLVWACAPAFNLIHNRYDQAFLQLLVAYWPLCLAGAALLIWEAPAQWGMLRRLQATRPGPYKILTFELNGPMRATNLTHLVDALMGAMLLALLVPPVTQSLHAVFTWPLRRLLQENLFPLLLPLALLVLPFPIGFVFYRQHRASGLGRLTALLVAVLRLTVVLNPLACRLGVRRGVITRCAGCDDFKFAWQPRCPHCAAPASGQLINAHEAGLRASWLRMDRPAVFYRIMIPAQLLIIILFLNLHHWIGK